MAPEIDWGDSTPKARGWESDEARRARQAKHTREAEWQAALTRRARLRWLLWFPFFLALCAAGVLLGLDKAGVCPLGIFPQPAPVVVAPPAPTKVPTILAALLPPPQEAEYAAPLYSEPDPPSAAEPVTLAVDPAQIARLKDRLAHAQNGVRMIAQELQDRLSAINGEDIAIYGSWRTKTQRNDDGLLRAQRFLGAKLAEARAAYNAGHSPQARANLDAVSGALESINVMMANTQTALAHDLDVAKSLRERLAKATDERDRIAAEVP